MYFFLDYTLDWQVNRQVSFSYNIYHIGLSEVKTISRPSPSEYTNLAYSQGGNNVQYLHLDQGIFRVSGLYNNTPLVRKWDIRLKHRNEN